MHYWPGNAAAWPRTTESLASATASPRLRETNQCEGHRQDAGSGFDPRRPGKRSRIVAERIPVTSGLTSARAAGRGPRAGEGNEVKLEAGMYSQMERPLPANAKNDSNARLPVASEMGYPPCLKSGRKDASSPAARLRSFPVLSPHQSFPDETWIFLPASTLSSLMPFHLRRSATLTPKRCEIRNRVSPCLTV